jgi:hypothetical protein
MLCDRDMILLMCGPLTSLCGLFEETRSPEDYGRTNPFLTNIMRQCTNFALTVYNSVIVAYHFVPNNHEILYMQRSLFFP